MLNSQDIYSHLLNGGDKQALYDALTKEIAEAEAKVQTTLELEKKDKERREKKDKARTAAFKALKTYFALVNPDITEDMVNSVFDTLDSVLSTLEVVEVKANGVRGKSRGDLYDMFGLFR